MATNDDNNNAIDCDDYDLSSELLIEYAKGDLHNALGIYKEAVEDSEALSSTSNKRARDGRSDIEREVEELLQDASESDLKVAAEIERSIEVMEVLEELIDKAVYGSGTGRIRDVLFEFFSKQIKEKKWALNKRMPRESRQKEFDELIKKLKIERRYASSIWRQYQDNRGVKSTIKIMETEDDLRNRFSEKANRINIAQLAIEKTVTQFDFDEDEAGQEIIFKVIMASTSLPPLINNRVAGLNLQFANILHKTTTTTSRSKMLAFENQQQDADGTFANTVCLPNFPNLPIVVTSNLLRRRFLGLALNIRKIWSTAIKETDDGNLLIDSVNAADVASVLKGSKGTVYFLAGWLLLKLSQQKAVRRQSAINKFVSHNSVTIGSSVVRTLPTDVVDHREKHAGKMRRVGHDFFRFVCMLEALYMVNLTPAVALAYRENFFWEVDEIVKKNKDLEDLFMNCIPPTCTENDKLLLLESYAIILQKYSSMRARDVLRRIRNSSINNAANGFATRALVKAVGLSSANKE